MRDIYFIVGLRNHYLLLASWIIDIIFLPRIKVIGGRFEFAPIGLLDMFNSGGAMEALESSKNESGCIVKMKIRGCGHFGCYSNTKPRYCSVDKADIQFTYDVSNGLLKFEFEGECKLRQVKIAYQNLDVTDSEGL